MPTKYYTLFSIKSLVLLKIGLPPHVSDVQLVWFCIDLCFFLTMIFVYSMRNKFLKMLLYIDFSLSVKVIFQVYCLPHLLLLYKNIVLFIFVKLDQVIILKIFYLKIIL